MTAQPTTAAPALFVNEQTGVTTCEEHAGRYLSAALAKRPNLKTTNTPLGRWIRSTDPEFACETCTRSNKNTTKKETAMPVKIAIPSKKSTKTAAAKTAKKETPVAEKKTPTKRTPAKKAAAEKKPATTTKKVAKPVAKKAAPKTNDVKMFLVYRNIENDVTAQARKAKSFDPIRYEGVIGGKTIASARKALDELKGDDAANYDVSYTYDVKGLSQKAMSKFDGMTEKVTKKANNTFTVTLRNVDGLSQYELEQTALYAWAVDAAKKAPKPTGNERMLDRDFKFEDIKTLKNDRANVTFTY